MPQHGGAVGGISRNAKSASRGLFASNAWLRVPPNIGWACVLLAASAVGRGLGNQAQHATGGFAALLISPLGLMAGWVLGLCLMNRCRRAGVAVLVALLQVCRVSPTPDLDRERLQGAGIPLAIRVEACARWVEGPYSLRSTCRTRTIGRLGWTRVFSREIRVGLPLEVDAPGGCARVRGRLRSALKPRNRSSTSSAADAPWTVSAKSRWMVQAESCGPWRDRWSRVSTWVGEVWRRAGPAEGGTVLGGESAPGTTPSEWELSDRAAVTGRRAWSLARAMWTGERDLVDRDVQAGFANWGLSHLLAASGLHVGVVLGMGALAASWLPGSLARLLGVSWMVGGSLFLLASVGPRPSILRALLMSYGVGLAVSTRRPTHGLGQLGLALVVLTVLRPGTAGDLGAVLSFAATAGVVLWTPRLVKAWCFLPALVAWPLAATVAAQLATMPWSHEIDPMVPLGAPVANLVAGPMAAWSLLYGGVTWCLAAAGRQPHQLVVSVFEYPVEGWLEVITGGPMPWLQPLWWGNGLGLALWCSAALVALLHPAISSPIVRVVSMGVLVALLFLPASGRTEASFLDVGQGDATLLRSGGEGILIDGGGWRGGDVSRAVHLPVLARSRIRSLEAVVLSHGDADHCLGLRDLARRFPIRELWLGVDRRQRGVSNCERDLIRRFRGRLRRLAERDRYRLGAWALEVLLDGSEGASDNDRSVALVARASSVEILLAGDLERAGERRLVANLPGERGAQMRVLKVAHHGSKTSTTAALVDAYRPDLALVGVGRRNVYGHPAPLVLRRLEERGVHVLRTDRDGRIDVVPSQPLDSSVCFNTAVGPVGGAGVPGEDQVDRNREFLVDAAAPANRCGSRPDRHRQERDRG